MRPWLLPRWNWTDSLLLVALAGLLVVRYLVLRPFEVVGADNANYLLTVRQVSGSDPSGLGLLRPPLVGLLLKPFVELLPATVALKAAGIVSSLIIALPFFKLSQRGLKPLLQGYEVVALVATLGFVSSYQFASMLAFGWLTFLGIFLVLLLMVKALDLWERPSRANVAAFAVTMLLVAATHQTTLLMAGVMVACALGGLGLSALRAARRDVFLPFLRGTGAAVVLGGLASLPLAPLYLRHATDYTTEQWPTSALALDYFSGQVSFFFHDAPRAWVFAAWMAVVGLVAVTRRQGPALAAWTAGLAVGPVLTTITAMDISNRAWMFIYAPLWLLAPAGVAWHLQELSVYLGRRPGWTRWASAVPLAGCLVLVGLMAGYQFYLYPRRLAEQAETHSSLDAEALAAARWAGDTLPAGKPVVAYPFSLGWWLEGAEGLTAFEIGSFPRKSQAMQSDIGQAVVSGDHVLFNGSTGLAWAFPADAPGDPQLLVRTGKEYQTSAYFDDATAMVELDQGGAARAVSLADIPASLDVQDDGQSATVTRRFQSEALEVVQTTLMGTGRWQVTVSYAFTARQGGIRQVIVPLRFNDFLTQSVTSQGLQAEAIHVGQDHSFAVRVVREAITSEASGASVEVRQPDDYTLEFVLAPQGPATSLLLSVHFEFEGALPAEAPVSHVNTLTALRDYGISALMVDEAPVNGLVPLSSAQLQWLESSPYYRRAYQSGRLSAFQVVAGGGPGP